MAEVQSANAPIGYQIQTSQPELILRHDISDEELDMLCQSRSDMALEILLVSLGSLLGTMPIALPFLYLAFTDISAMQIQLTALVQVLIFSASLTGAITTFVVYYRRANSSKNLRDAIRKRTEPKAP